MNHNPWIKLARRSLEDYFKGINRTPSESRISGEGVFVSLHKSGRLRGCIGCLEGQDSLEELVYRYARIAAFQDNRFPPLQEEELPQIDIEITLLSPFQEVKNLEEIIIGTHGLYLVKGYYSGLFLPQVPVEQHWNLEEYLQNLCIKAGLPQGSWTSEDAQLFKFTGKIINENSENN